MSDNQVMSDQDRNQGAMEALNRIHAETMAKLADLRRQQMDLYRRVSARLDALAARKAADSLSGQEGENA